VKLGGKVPLLRVNVAVVPDIDALTPLVPVGKAFCAPSS
jgi:hypothetical protein